MVQPQTLGDYANQNTGGPRGPNGPMGMPNMNVDWKGQPFF